MDMELEVGGTNFGKLMGVMGVLLQARDVHECTQLEGRLKPQA